MVDSGIAVQCLLSFIYETKCILSLKINIAHFPDINPEVSV